ncbi:site-2 protease family protein [Limnoraphis robusta]|uniref:Site-2 protease family protein n=1 Tax=Limnoraphis robusta CCNP1315 TaxID=3110306 RepID=A0ABU5U7E1_9CYAN|nr:site-2 protease family protein [Limnoraphis robusta]MEA5522777.1 site-2 protease family protein [Limnoraphis robusta CCNP1315]MEA5543761.1 site-2 protease family protein [Limnoraphis robusta CCNP1324]
MFTAFDNTTIFILFIALGIVGWGYYRAQPYGKLGVLSWLQSVVLIAPWLLFFALAAAGIYLNLASILFLFLASTGLYIIFGRKLRVLASEDQQKRSESQANSTVPESNKPSEPEEKTPVESVETLSLSQDKPTPIPAEDLKIIQSIFGIDTFFATETLPYQEGVIFKGNLRTDADKAYTRLSENLQQQTGDRFRLFLVENPEGKPVIIVLPRKNDPQSTTIPQKVLAIILLLVSVFTTFEAGSLLLGFDFFTEPNRYAEILPIAIGLCSILAIHEIAHQLMAKRHQVKFGWPFFIPTIQIGTFGAFNRFESILPNRTVLFDVALAGPAAGGLLSLGMLLVGLVLSHPGSFFQIPTEYFQGSVLVGTLAKAVLGSALNEPIVDVHPLMIIGWLGLVITAINLMPAGQLDGGRILQAIYGRKIAGRSTLATFIVLAIASLANSLALYWAVVILILQRNLERPSLNELTEPDDTRAALGLLALFLMIATLFPLTPALASRLGIGG